MKIGHRYIVRCRIWSKIWYPDLGGSKESAHEFACERDYDMMTNQCGLSHVGLMLDTLIDQNFGKLGMNEGVGVDWNYVVDSLKYEGEVYYE